MKMVKDEKSDSENVEVSLPGVHAAKLLTVSRAIYDGNTTASTAARTTVNS